MPAGLALVAIWLISIYLKQGTIGWTLAGLEVETDNKDPAAVANEILLRMELQRHQDPEQKQ